MASMALAAAAAPSPCTLARVRVMETNRSSWAACRAAPMVHSFPKSMTFLMASASRLPAVAPLTIEAVIPSMPCEAPRAALAAVCSMLDRLVLTLLMEAFARLASTSTTSSSLLSEGILRRRSGRLYTPPDAGGDIEGRLLSRGCPHRPAAFRFVLGDLQAGGLSRGDGFPPDRACNLVH